MSIDELWQSYRQNGEPDRPISKDEARAGVLHGASHVWVWRRSNDGSQIEILLQRRAKNKLTWPGFLDISAAGHIDAGEAPIIAAVREASEELALPLVADDLQLLFVRHVDHRLDSGVRENEFVWVYLYELPADSASFNLQKEEVDSVQWLSLGDLVELSHGTLSGDKVVPHIYFPDLIDVLRQV